MTEFSQLMPLDQIRAGMFLAEAILDRFGNVMLPEGLELSEQTLESLKERGVASARVRVDNPPMTAEEREAQTTAMRNHLARLFRSSLGSPLNRQLHNVVLQYRMEQLR